MITEYYNIHNIVKILIRKSGKIGFYGDLNRELFYFRSEPVDPNIILNIGDFTPQNNNCIKVGNNYIKDNYLFSEDAFGKIKWKIEIKGWEQNKFEINYYPEPSGVRRFFKYFIMQNIFLKELIEILFINSGYNPIHGGAVSYGDNGYIFEGRQHSYKTSIIMDFIRKNYSFIGDDRVIIKDNTIYSFPINIPSFTFWMKYLENEDAKIQLQKIRLFFWTIYMIKKGNYPIKIKNKSLLKKIFVIKNESDSTFSLNKIDIKLLFNNLEQNCREEWDEGFIPTFTGLRKGFFGEYYRNYIHVNQHSKLKELWTNYQDNLNNNIKCDSYQIIIPNRYDKKIVDTLINLMN